MKIYLNGLEKDVAFDETTTRQLIYTTEGIFCNYKKKLTQLEYIEKHDIVKVNNYSFLVDLSIEKYGNTILHIPYEHIYCEETYEKKHIGYNIYYIKCSYFDQISYYFETESNNEYLEDTIFKEIITFLSI